MKINLAVIYGGASVEHEVSVITAVQAMLSVDRGKYNVIPVYMTKGGLFYTGQKLFDIDNYKDIKKLTEGSEQVIFARDERGASLVRYPAKRFSNNVVSTVDVVLPVGHGTSMEDGALQGMLETMGVPYCGCDVLSSAVGMDKYAMKVLLKDAGIPVLDGVCFAAKDFYLDPQQILDMAELRVSYPMIVKPVNLGSSVGIKIAADRAALEAAIDHAASYSQRILIEHALTNMREINCSVLGDYQTARASLCEEPIAADEILSYEDKYMAGSKGSKGMSSAGRRLPAEISDDLTEEIRALAVRTFKTLNCCGVARIDFMLDNDTEKVYVNEINTIPGSLSFYLWEPAGVSYTELLSELVDTAFKRARERKSLNFSFDTNLLSQNSLKGLKGAKGKLG